MSVSYKGSTPGKCHWVRHLSCTPFAQFPHVANCNHENFIPLKKLSKLICRALCDYSNTLFYPVVVAAHGEHYVVVLIV